MLKITIEEHKDDTIVLQVERRKATKMERLIEQKKSNSRNYNICNWNWERLGKTPSLLHGKLIVENELKILYNKNINL